MRTDLFSWVYKQLTWIYSTLNLSAKPANQASYTVMIPHPGQLHQSPKERKLESFTRLP